MMHDIISDILTADTVPHDQKREAIYGQIAELRDSTRNVMSWEEWRHMGELMGGVDLMGGPATGLIEARPTPPPSTDHGPHEQPRAPVQDQASDSADHGDAHQRDERPRDHEGHH
jgi:hypothetical protein